MLELVLETVRCPLNDSERERIRHQLGGLERRLVHFPEPIATLILQQHVAQLRVTADLRVQLGPLGSHLISRQAAETADQAVRRAVAKVERQLERQLARQRGEPTFGTPSRRFPEALRPHPPGGIVRTAHGEAAAKGSSRATALGQGSCRCGFRHSGRV